MFGCQSRALVGDLGEGRSDINTHGKGLELPPNHIISPELDYAA